MKHYQHVDLNSIYETKDKPYANFPWACRLSTLHFYKLGRIPVRLTNAAPWYFRIAEAHLHDPDFGVLNVNMIAGRRMIEIQAHLYRVLVDVCTEIMKLSSIPQDQWLNWRVYPPRTPNEPPIGDVQEMSGLLQRYYGPPKFDNLRIRELLNAQVSKVTDLLLDLRANPQSLEACVLKERLRSDPSASNVKLEEDFNLLEEKTWMDSVRTCVATALEDVDRWTGLRDACYELPVDFSPAESVFFLAFNQHVQEIKKYLFKTFEQIPPGTDPLSSGYFSINPVEKIGPKTEKRLHTLHAKLVLLTGERKRRDLEANVLESILGSLQVDLGRSKCPINSEVRRLVEGLALVTECEVQTTIYMAKFKRIFEADRKDRVKMAHAQTSLWQYRETWKDLRDEGTWKELRRLVLLGLGLPRGGRLKCPAEDSSDAVEVCRQSEQKHDKFWEELTYFLEDREVISGLTVRLLRDQSARQQLHRSEPVLAASADDNEECPKLVDTSLKSLWDETSSAKQERRRLESAPTSTGATQERLVELNATSPPGNGPPAPCSRPGPRKILVKEETFDVLRMLWNDKEDGRPSGTLDWSDFTRAMDSMGFHFDGGRAGSR